MPLLEPSFVTPRCVHIRWRVCQEDASATCMLQQDNLNISSQTAAVHRSVLSACKATVPSHTTQQQAHICHVHGLQRPAAAASVLDRILDIKPAVACVSCRSCSLTRPPQPWTQPVRLWSRKPSTSLQQATNPSSAAAYTAAACLHVAACQAAAHPASMLQQQQQGQALRAPVGGPRSSWRIA